MKGHENNKYGGCEFCGSDLKDIKALMDTILKYSESIAGTTTIKKIVHTLDVLASFCGEEYVKEDCCLVNLLVPIKEAFKVDGDISTGQARKAFISEGIHTLGDLVLKSEDEITKYYHVGNVTLLKVRTILEKYGLKLKD